jgi:CrcB protein
MGVYFYPSLMLAGGMGAILRYWCGRMVFGGQWSWVPVGTLTANLLGCFLMGFLSALFVYRWQLSVEWQRVILIGFLGGFTTFSAFSLETVALLEQGAGLRAVLYVATSVTFSVLLCLAGLWLARQTFS